MIPPYIVAASSQIFNFFPVINVLLFFINYKLGTWYNTSIDLYQGLFLRTFSDGF